MNTVILIAIWFAVAIILWQLFTSQPKKTNYEKVQIARQRQNKKKQKLLRFQRGSKTLNPDQKKELDRVNKSNFSILKQMWKDEHL